VIHIEDDIHPPRHRTLCGLPDAGLDVLRGPLPSLDVITCPDCRQRIRECEEEGNPR
jgi:hypothetical protein